jgi:demethylmenaquinone methyltransferase/2-methoxy-6-polyprenyl-1,4-benzoquinol methylase
MVGYGAALHYPLWSAPMSDETTSYGFQEVPARAKQGLVRSVFARVAGKYDLMNDLMSMGLHRLWKDALAFKANPQPGMTIIDMAGGTGDVARRLKKLADKAAHRRGGEPARVIVMDINADMLAAGRARGEDHMEWVQANAEAMPLPDSSADMYTIAFGIRNVTHREQALAEALRVLKPGGWFYCLEFSQVHPSLRGVYDAYSFGLIPKFGQWTTGDAEPYQYLVESIRRFPKQADFAAELRAAHFVTVGFENMSAGAAALHWGQKPR